MQLSSLTLLIAIGVLIIAVLTSVAVYYLLRLRQQNQRLEQARLEQELALAERRDKVNFSIQRLAQATLEDSLSLTEASIRIGVLMDSLPVAEQTREKYRAFYLLSEKTAHIPILEQWKQLSAKEQREFDLQRLKLEDEYGDFVREAAKQLLGDTV